LSGIDQIVAMAGRTVGGIDRLSSRNLCRVICGCAGIGNARKRHDYGDGRSPYCNERKSPSQTEQFLLAHGNDIDAPGMKEAATGGLSSCVTV
jgi:hypothetical protein